MKLRISSCKTAFRKDLTRFAPVWGLYGVWLLLSRYLGLLGDEPVMAADYLGRSLGGFATLNMVYAALCAQMLFGDLFRQRLCNALHALPLKRSDWFFCHVSAGLSFSLVPNTLCALLMMPMLGRYWFVSLLWLAAVTLEYLFFFGLACLSMHLAGNRFAMVAVYSILNFLSILLLWIVERLIMNRLLGSYVSSEWFFRFCPVIQLNAQQELIRFEWVLNTKVFAGLGAGWGYLLILGGVGVLLGGIALMLYRRRALETAGDFLSFTGVAPVFSVLYTLSVTALFGVVGFVTGYFTSQMLLRRTVKIFKRKVFLWFGIFAAVIIAAIVLVILDPAGYKTRVPAPNQVVSVEISMNAPDVYWDEKRLKLEEPADVAALVKLHQQVVEKNGAFDSQTVTSLYLRYTLQDGKELTRFYYQVPARELEKYFSRAEYVLGLTGDQDAYLETVSQVTLDNGKLAAKDARELLKAVIADCEAGTMAQGGLYDSGKVYITWLEIQTVDGQTRRLAVHENSENTVHWLKENFDLWGGENRNPEDYFKN